TSPKSRTRSLTNRSGPSNSGRARMAPVKRDDAERLGAHVSTQGGVQTAPGRGSAIGATAIQLFTKTPNQWKEPALSEVAVREFRKNLESSDLKVVVSHDSYLI